MAIIVIIGAAVVLADAVARAMSTFHDPYCWEVDND